MVEPSLRVLGIDPGYGRCGWGVIQVLGNRLQSLGCGVIETPPGQHFAQRLEHLHHKLQDVIRQYAPHESAIEELFFSKNVKTAIDVGQARGVVVLTCSSAKIPVAAYKPGEVKMAVTGHGSAAKLQVQRMVKVLLNMEQVPRSDDAADALAVAICHVHWRKHRQLCSGTSDRM